MCEASSLGGVAVSAACENKIQYVFNGCGSSDQKATDNSCPLEGRWHPVGKTQTCFS